MIYKIQIEKIENILQIYDTNEDYMNAHIVDLTIIDQSRCIE